MLCLTDLLMQLCDNRLLGQGKINVASLFAAVPFSSETGEFYRDDCVGKLFDASAAPESMKLFLADPIPPDKTYKISEIWNFVLPI